MSYTGLKVGKMPLKKKLLTVYCGLANYSGKLFTHRLQGSRLGNCITQQADPKKTEWK
jgi:hypothetical protein